MLCVTAPNAWAARQKYLRCNDAAHDSSSCCSCPQKLELGFVPNFTKHPRGAHAEGTMRAGAIPINWFALACELQRDWRQEGKKLLQVRPTFIFLRTATEELSKGEKGRDVVVPFGCS